jgi:hypothetical protein
MSTSDVTLEELGVENIQSLVDSTLRPFQQFLATPSWYVPSGRGRVGRSTLPTFTFEPLPEVALAGQTE